MLDLTNECEQREFARGPVPEGSIVMVEIEILKPNQERQAHDNPFISVASSGLRQIYCQFTVSHGQYQGVSFRQNMLRELPRIPKLPHIEYEHFIPPTQQELALVFVHAPEHVRRVVILGSQMGMRVGPSELFGLMWSDVDLENKVIHLRAAQKNKAEPVRDIPIRQSLVEELKAWQEVDRAKRVASVIHYGGKPVKCIHGAWHRTLLRAGIQRRIRPYDLRHAFVTEAIAAGVDIGTVGKLVGHANLTMILKHYQHVLSSQKRAAVEAIPEPQYVAKNMWQSESTPENIKQ